MDMSILLLQKSFGKNTMMMLYFISTACYILSCARAYRPSSSSSSVSSRRYLSASKRISAVFLPQGLAEPKGYFVKEYEYDGWKLTYRYKPPSPGYENESPLLLVHPVGIGLSSFFFEKFTETWKGSAVYAVNLIGCGLMDGNNAWDPDERGLFFPLSWTKGCEALLDQVILPEQRKRNPGIFGIGSKQAKCTVMVQGGLAPVGVQLAARRPGDIERLILTSPPTWDDMTTAIPESELKFNYDFLRSKILGKLAFYVLESRWAVRFFSDLFLFADKCDEHWLGQVAYETSEAGRTPVQAFNAGLCMHRSYLEELTSLEVPVLVLQGQADEARIEKRKPYELNMKDCTLKTLPGKNVLPWESAPMVCEAIASYT